MKRLIYLCAFVLAGALAVAALVIGPAGGGTTDRARERTPSSGSGADATSAAPAFTPGLYRVKIGYRRSTTVVTSQWELAITGNKIRGTSYWTCCPGKRVDPVTGTLTGNRAVIVRDCRGQGIKGPCRQTYRLTVTSPKTLKGTYTGTASEASPIVTMTLRPTCKKQYVVTPSGAPIKVNRFFVELTPAQIATKIRDEQDKYAGYEYTPIAPATRKQNCAGYVMRRLFGAKIVQANVEPDVFFAKIVKPYGEKRLSWLTARTGDVVVFRRDGAVRHVAWVKSNSPVAMQILTKDGNERVYKAVFTRSDPLIRAHGPVEFWRVDRSRVSIRAASDTPCDA